MSEYLSFMGRDLVVEPRHLSAEEEMRLQSPASHCCPNCDGPLTVGDHEAAGICSRCYWSPTEH